jgi:hypothetical protein
MSALSPGISLQYPFDRMDWPQYRSGRRGKEGNITHTGQPLTCRCTDRAMTALHNRSSCRIQNCTHRFRPSRIPSPQWSAFHCLLVILCMMPSHFWQSSLPLIIAKFHVSGSNPPALSGTHVCLLKHFIGFLGLSRRMQGSNTFKLVTASFSTPGVLINAMLSDSRKGKVVPVPNQALRHGDVWGSECIGTRSLHLCTSWRWIFSFTPLPLYLRGKSLRYRLDRMMGGLQSQSGRYEEVELWPLGRPARSQSLYRLRYDSS